MIKYCGIAIKLSRRKGVGGGADVVQIRHANTETVLQQSRKLFYGLKDILGIDNF